MNNKIILASLLASSLAMGGCFFHGGSHEHVNLPTLGQELTDLQVAFDKGAISQQEYEREKARLLREQHRARSEQSER
ncbi:SHOCT domain-containing protein [Marinimicrobium alkaliphilum]|uniref:SHOCT domain-containing protein n=1 Tax=Marinimicrobium alkaliphilum TaxID=2202654 RepID=UPI0013006E6A|nr:SHOCT domain-containing protein [Marinimicrobium alkaliphilum]